MAWFLYHIHKTVDLTIDNRKEQTLDSPSTMGIIMGIQLASSNMCNTYIIIYIYIVWIHIKGVRMRFTINCTWENSFPTQPALSSKSVYRKGPLVKVAGHLKQQLFELHLRFSCKASQWKAQTPLNSVTVKRSLASGLQPIPFTGIPL